MKESTRLVSAGRNPERFEGVVNTPIVRGSTLLSPNMAHWADKNRRHADDEFGVSIYGRYGTATHHALQDAITEISGGHRTMLYPSGLAAIASVVTALVSTGDHVLLTDSVYSATTQFLARTLKRFGVAVTRYDPRVGGGIARLIQDNTRVVFVESPGSETFEMQDIPAIARAAHARGAYVVMDNTWATPLFFKAFDHGVDVSIQAATKYIVGHSDAMLGVATCNEASWNAVRETSQDFGQTCSPDDAFLALRGLRTMSVRLRQHWASGVQVAQWLESRPEVDSVLHPALPSHPGHALWKRDYTGACGLFAIALKPVPEPALHAFIDSLKLFGLGLSWGGYESLALPFSPAGRGSTQWPYAGPGVRLHIGLEDPADLTADLEQGFQAMSRTLRGIRGGLAA
ncbi:cystathionine beta-lyase [Parapusillimonas granuli]|uniref:Cystathionine beta-lyase n=1 Tax=Parapusillimonas granuli TaxID=380911 RepID=A0A853FVT0_9BURK|nr:cystathionine beta-lyase [Parapusillimonas granuli]MBB5216141.1 cystathionine beta-lyase [Parapusillimonas granuli]NYT47822.1 cystathionine beta-lyase [Parapusillimonas granuli]